MRRADVVVVGAGVMGTSTARALGDRGLDVVLLEQFALGHARGSSHGRSRIFRLSYPDPAYVDMAQRSLALWRALEERTGRTLVVTTGGVDAGEPIGANAAALAACDAPFELVDGAEIGRRFPFLSLPASAPALFQPDAGIALAEEALAAFTALARAAGAEVRERQRVEALDTDGGGAVVRTASEAFGAPVVVVTAGAWAAGLLAGVGIDLPVRPTRETVAYFAFDGPPPPSLVEWGEPAAYCLAAPGHGIKSGEHIAGPVADPDDEGAVSHGSIERIAGWVAARFPGMDAVPVHAETCLYTNTSDERFILERHGPFVVGSPCSGHGFKFAPLIGERLADLATQA